jgi:hypothetical protein
LSAVKRILRDTAYLVPGTQALWVRVNKAFGNGPRPAFSGWGMETDAYTPWHAGGGDDVARAFMRANAEVLDGVASGRLVLSQFKEVQDIAAKLRELMWRHYLVVWSARYAASATECHTKNLAECGVCDGLSSYFAMSALKGAHPFQSFLYDAWTGMDAGYLLETERASAGAYAYLSLENTKRNLAPFESHTTFVEGFIPDTFERFATPAEVVWLHIDLNSSVPTTAALHEFFDRMPAGGVILLDDYAWQGFYDTKVAADRFFAGRRGHLLPLPTGQAMFFKL